MRSPFSRFLIFGPSLALDLLGHGSNKRPNGFASFSVPRGLLSSHPPDAPHLLSLFYAHTHPGNRLSTHLIADLDLLAILTLLIQE
ncbi:hypothetical protein HYDPIDRAFT_115434 [Hydnomerulius pinastri MD-312]|uniref:Secreted protein n=1 Tax=Hydnomerulius pinastri MD-312 TaxID=994086 RepID=A0A0C9WC22_9AGAM|nr:hypothetical protein HYDPIDRAFT_115434 [Hydnomerulius pinastri MD-312]